MVALDPPSWLLAPRATAVLSHRFLTHTPIDHVTHARRVLVMKIDLFVPSASCEGRVSGSSCLLGFLVKLGRESRNTKTVSKVYETSKNPPECGDQLIGSIISPRAHIGLAKLVMTH